MDFVLDQPDFFPHIASKIGKRSALREMIEVFREHGACATPAMVAAAIGVSRQRVHQLVNAGRIATVDVAGHPMIPLAALELFLTEERRNGRHVYYKPPGTFSKVISDWKKK